jgi:pilus assembly protein TadC
MLTLSFLLIFISIFVFIMAFIPFDTRPTLNLGKNDTEDILGIKKKEIKKGPLGMLFDSIRKMAVINKPLALTLGKNYTKNLSLSQTGLSVEEFLLIKQLGVVFIILISMKINPDPSFLMFSVLIGIAAGWIIPDIWLKGRVRSIKDTIVKELPDAVDLLGLCVNAGLDFMMAIKYIIEKSPPSVVIEELKIMMQEISVGKTRRDALRGLAHKYDLPDLFTFARTLIQADRMGTSVAEALNILSEDMREARFRRGESMALKAPLKMLVPLLFCIFPVVAILVAGPIFMDFFHNNPLQGLGK